MRNRIIASLIIAAMMLITACSTQQGIQPAVSADAVNTENAQTVEVTVQSESEPTVSTEDSSAPTSLAIEPVHDEDGVRYISNSADRISLGTFDKLNERADFIVTGVCISSKPVFRKDFLYTLSEIKINEVYRGDGLAKDNVILVMEWGGRTTFGEYQKNCNIEEKAFYTGEPLPSDYKLVTGMDGYFPLNENEQVLLFLGDETGFFENIKEPLYGIWGDYDGKLFLQPDGVTYSTTLPSENDQLIFGEGTLKITVDELKEKIGKEKPKAK